MEQLVEMFHYTFVGIEVWVFGAAFGAIFAGFVLKKIVGAMLTRFARATEKTKFAYDDILIKALQRPAEWAIMLVGLFVALSVLPLPETPVDIRRFVNAIITATIATLVVWFAMRLVDGIMELWTLKAAETDSKLDDQLVPIVRRSTKVFLVIIGVVLVLQNLGYSVGSLLAGLGIGGVAVAMASKDTIANLFGSLVIFMDKPFRIGDWIETGDVEGTVEEVGLRTTRIRTFANSLITVPNHMFTTQAINNWSRMKKRRIKMSLGVTYASSAEKIDELVKRLRRIIEEDDNIHNDFYLVNFDNFGPSSLDIFIYCFTVTTNWSEFLQVKQELMLKMMRAVSQLGLSFAFPSQSVYVERLPANAPAAMEGERPR